MAHQSQRLPWDTFSSTFTFIPNNFLDANRTNLYFQNKPGQTTHLNRFALEFADALKQDSTTERAKHPSTYDPPQPDDPIITPAIEKKITPSLHQCRSNNPFQLQHQCAHRIWHGLKVSCTCPLLDSERRASFFVEAWRSCPQTCSSTRERHHDPIELIKMLILHNEMEPLLELHAIPDLNVSCHWWCFPYDISQKRIHLARRNEMVRLRKTTVTAHPTNARSSAAPHAKN